MSIVNPKQLPTAQPLKKTDILIIQQEQTCQAPLSYLDTYFAPVASFKQTSIAVSTNLIAYDVPEGQPILYRIDGYGVTRVGGGATITIYYTDSAGVDRTQIFSGNITTNPINIFCSGLTSVTIGLTVPDGTLVDYAVTLTALI